MADWHDEAAFCDWLKGEGERLGWPAPQIHPPRRRSWSLVYEVRCEDGARYFAKASAPPLRFEAPLTVALAEWEAGFGPAVLAQEGGQGWLILADAGQPLRERVGGADLLCQWRRFLPRFAAMQRRMQGRAADLLALGLPDRRLERLPLRLRSLLEGKQAPRTRRAGGWSGEEGLSADEWRALHQGIPVFTDECARLAESGRTPSLHHDDFHDGNLFLGQDGALVLADWGESALAHPFFSLRVALRYLAHSLGLAPAAPELEGLVDSYLSVWGDPVRLRAELALALRLASVNRALTWAECAALSDDPEDYRGAAAWLRQYLRGAPCDGAYTD